jgi:glycosyltransferase involved in cell wall biosynthesis
MKIAQVAPLAESVPPRLYGGTERVVSYLTEELVRLGHEVTLFASGDSQTPARLVACAPRALRLDPEVTDALPHHLLMIERVRSRVHEFDVVHFHVEHVHLPLFRRYAHKCVTTLHGRLDLPDLVPLYREFHEMPLVSISNSQRRPLAGAHWVGTVYHGLPDAVCPYNPAPRGQYLAFLGRISPEKGIEHAIEIAHRAGQRLRIAAKIDRTDDAYWHSRVKRLVSGPLIEFVGEVSEEDKPSFLGNASALLFPIDWPEPFGLVMIEAMSCGTPVIAWPRGSVPEIVEPGVTGFITSSVDEAVAAVGAAVRLDRARVRQRFEERFSATRMALDYLALYRRVGVKKTELVP